MLRQIKTPPAPLTESTTLSNAIEKLKAKKISNEFHWSPAGFSVAEGKTYHPDDLKVITTYRFHGESDPSDSSILYIIKANDGLIGYLVFTIINKMKKITKDSISKYLLKKK